MADIELKSARFRREREADWRRLEGLLRRLESQPLSKLDEEDLLAIPVLYRASLSALSVARETSLDKALLDYLESLCARAYFVVYGVRPALGERLTRFFRHDWPAAARALWRETLLAAALLVSGALIAAWLYHIDTSWYSAFIPQQMAGGREPGASTAMLRHTLYSTEGRNFLEAFAAFLFTHNAEVSILAFALGFAFGAPTALLMVSNGCALGALISLYAANGLLIPLIGWLMIHGTTELFATVLAGAGGFHIGWSIAFPGERTRMEAIAIAGRRASTLMAGVLVMLACAGVLEGVGRQLVTSDVARYAIAITVLAGWLYYLYGSKGGR